MRKRSATKISKMPVVLVRVEPNYDGSYILWNIKASDGAASNGFAKTPADAMRDAAAFVEAMMQPRVGGFNRKPKLEIVP